MKKLVSIALATLMIVAVFASAFSASAEAPNFMSEYLPDGVKDVLAGAKGTLLCDPNAKNDDGNPNTGTDLGTLLTDGIIAANVDAASTTERIHLNYCTCDGDYHTGITFPGLENQYCYAVQFDNLQAVTVKSFTLYYSGQNDGTLNGRSIPESHTDKDIAILYSIDNGLTFQIAFESDVGNFGSNDLYSENMELETTAEGGFFNFRVCKVTLPKAINGITNLIYAAKDRRQSDTTWPARLSEFSAFEGDIPETTKAPETTRDPDATTAPRATKARVTTATPETTKAPDADTQTPDTQKTEESGCGSVAAIGVAAIVAMLGIAVLRKKD